MRHAPAPFRPAIGSFLLALSLLFFTGCSPRQPDEPVLINPILGYLKIPSPKLLTDKSLTLVNQLDTSGQIALFVPFLLAGYGYPSYTGIDPETDISIFYLQGESVEEPELLALVKGESDAKLIQQTVPEMNLVMENWGEEWLAITESQSAMDMVESREELLEIATRSSTYDFEITLLPDGLLETRDAYIEAALARTEVKNVEDPELARAWLEASLKLFFDELAATRSLVMGGNLNEEFIGWGMDLEAKQGSPLGDLIATGSPGRVDGGHHISTRDSFGYVLDFPARALQPYLEHLIDGMRSNLPESAGRDLDILQENLNTFSKSWSGLGAGSYSLNSGQIRVQQVLEGNFDPGKTRAFYDYVMTDLYPRMQDEASPEDTRMTIDYTPEAGTIAGVSYHWIHQGYETDGANGTDTTEEAAPMTQQDVYIAVADGNYIQTGSLDDLESIILRVQGKRDTNTPLSSAFSPAPNTWFQGRLDLVRYYLEMLENLPAESLTPRLNDGTVRKTLEMLSREQLDPIFMSATSSGTRLSYQVEVPVTTLQTAVSTFQEVEKNPPDDASSE